MARQVGQDSHCFNLNLIVLCLKQVVFGGCENCSARFWFEQRALCSVIVKDIGDATHRIQDELLVLVNIALCNRTGQFYYELAERLLQPLEFCHGGLFFSSEVSEKFD